MRTQEKGPVEGAVVWGAKGPGWRHNDQLSELKQALTLAFASFVGGTGIMIIPDCLRRRSE